MVTVEYLGRTGNNLFQYAFARLLAEKNGLELKTPWLDQDFIKIDDIANPDANPLPGETIEINDLYRDPHGRPLLDGDYRGKNVKLCGFFQNADFYNSYREKIKKWFDPCETGLAKDADVVAHLRLADYWWSRNKSVIHPSYYWQAFALAKSQGFSNIVVVVEPHKTNREFLPYLLRYKPAYVSITPRQDFQLIRSAKAIICSNSSFCWWAAFLSDARFITTFGPWMNNKGIPLAPMVGAKVLGGTFLRSTPLEKYDWTDYWREK